LSTPTLTETEQIRLFGGIHAAKGPAMAGTQGPGELAGLRGFQKTPHVLHAMSSPLAETCGGTDAARSPHERMSRVSRER
ncbi:hypothetical protein VDF70_19670, partial [Xanthomonas campestris pv. raphani]|uniref:hypothetical protein n=1 Tax=Xanthomonas campestris TaxID=339 RepID=UPI002B236E18